MPRPIESQEARILRYFHTAPLAAALLLAGLVADAVKGRKPKPARATRATLTPPAPAPAEKPKKSHHKQASHHAAPAQAGKVRKRHKRPRPTNGSEGAEVESFNLPD